MPLENQALPTCVATEAGAMLTATQVVDVPPTLEQTITLSRKTLDAPTADSPLSCKIGY